MTASCLTMQSARLAPSCPQPSRASPKVSVPSITTGPLQGCNRASGTGERSVLPATCRDVAQDARINALAITGPATRALNRLIGFLTGYGFGFGIGVQFGNQPGIEDAGFLSGFITLTGAENGVLGHLGQFGLGLALFICHIGFKLAK